MAKNIESLVEKEIQKGSTPLKLDSVMVPAEGFRDIDNRDRLINILQYLLRVREHKKLIWNDTLSANNVYMDVFLGKTDFHRAALITGREEIYQHINWYGGKLKPDYNGKTVIETDVCAFSIAEDELEKCKKTYDGKEAYSFYFGKYQIRSLRIWHGMRLHHMPLMQVHNRRHMIVNHRRRLMENTVSFSG